MRWKFKIRQLMLINIILLTIIAVSGKVFLDNRTYGYIGVVVGVTDDAENNVTKAMELIDNIKELVTNASQLLYTTTGNRLHFQHVTILVPYSWREFNSTYLSNFCQNEVFHFASVHVREMNPDHGDCPYTLQRGDCTESGDYIHLTPKYLASLHDIKYVMNYGDPVKVFVSEWMRFRFGVFSEDNPDIFYYNPEKGGFLPSYCANEVVNGSLINPATKTQCYVDEFGMPLEYCHFEPGLNDNDGLTSSLLFSTKLKTVAEFCNETTHNKFSATLQNRRCKGKSAWEIMRQHSDFSNTTQVRINSTIPEFQIVTAYQYPSLVLAIDQTAKGNKSLANPIIASVSQYLLFAVPDNTTVEIVAVEGCFDDDMYNPIQIDDIKDRLSLIDIVKLILSDGSEEDSVVHFPNKKLFGGSDWSSGTVVYITTSVNVTGNWSRLNGARFLPIFLNVNPNLNLTYLADDSDGQSYAFFGNEWQLEEDLSSALYDSSHYWDGDQVIQIFSAIVSENQQLPLSYLLDSAVVGHTRVLISTTANITSSDELFLVSPDHFYSRNDSEIYDIGDCRIFQMFSLINEKAGMWSLRSGQPLNPSTTLVVKVFAVIPQATSTVVASAQINTKSVQAYNNNIPVPRLTITLKKDGGLADPASVAVTIFTPCPVNGSSSNVTKNPRDDGSGADVIRNDGVYSMYVNHITANGVYKIVPKVYGGNGMDCLSGKSTDCFQRAPCPLYIEVMGYSKGTSDNISPGNITDLVGKFKFNSYQDAIVSLVWTAPGDDSSDGKVWGYDLQIFETYEDACNFIGGSNISDMMIISGSLAPVPTGLNQSVTVRFSSAVFGQLTSGYISMRAFDEFGNYAAGSNIVIIPLAAVDDASTSTTEIPSTTDIYINYTTTEIPSTTDIYVNYTTTTNFTDNITTTAIPLHRHAYDGVISSVILLCFAMCVAGGIFAQQKIKSSKEKKKPKHQGITGAPITVTVV